MDFLLRLHTKFIAVVQKIDQVSYNNPRIVPLRRKHYLSGIALDLFCILLILFIARPNVSQIISPLVTFGHLQPLTDKQKGYEVFGFAPYWNINKLDNVDFNVLTTFAYFGIPVGADGELNQD